MTRNHGSGPSVTARPADRMTPARIGAVRSALGTGLRGRGAAHATVRHARLASPNFVSLIETIGRIDPTLPEIDHPDSVIDFLTALGGHSPR